MSKDKFQAHCTIMRYLDSKYPDVADLMRGTCADMTLNSTRGKSGITLLLPTDAALLKSIEADAYSADPKIARRACDRLNAMILRGVYKSASEMHADKNLANSLFPAQKVDVKSVAAGKVEFANGAVATLDKDFVDSSAKSNLAVWLLSGKDGLPVTTDKPASMEKSPRKGKGGGYQDTDISNRVRHQISDHIENEYATQIKVNQDKNAYCQATKSLLSFIKVKDEELFESLCLHVCHSILDFYILVQPHGYKSALISDADIKEWWNEGNPEKVDCITVSKYIEAALAKKPERLALAKKVDEQRRLVQPGRDICNTVAAAYEKLDADFKSLCPLFSDAKQRMVEDSLKYMAATVCPNLTPNDLAVYNHLKSTIADCIYDAVKGTRYNTPICNEAKIKYHIQPQDDIKVVQGFVDSSMFMCVPLTREECKGMSGKVENVHADLWKMIE